MGSLFNKLLDIPFRTPELVVVHDVLTTICIVAMAVAAIASIILVLLQPSNSDGSIDALGGSSETFYGKNKGRSIESKLKLWTYVCLGLLAAFSVLLFILQIKAIWA